MIPHTSKATPSSLLLAGASPPPVFGLEGVSSLMIDASRIFSTLDDMEQDFVEAEAAARGVSINHVVIELVREGLADEDMEEILQTTDRQWKSH